MVWLNQQHINQTPPPGVIGGSRCTCPRCRTGKYIPPTAEELAEELFPKKNKKITLNKAQITLNKALKKVVFEKLPNTKDRKIARLEEQIKKLKKKIKTLEGFLED